MSCVRTSVQNVKSSSLDQKQVDQPELGSSNANTSAQESEESFTHQRDLPTVGVNCTERGLQAVICDAKKKKKEKMTAKFYNSALKNTRGLDV